jgi:co-chaperonin GroES (HSP10)
MAFINATITPIHDNILVHNMHFGEQQSSGGLIILGDDGKDRGIYPRWGQVYAKGSANTEEYQVGDWLLIEHGRWTRGAEIGTSEETKSTIRMVDLNCILMWTKEKPQGILVAETLTAVIPNEDYRI